MYLKLFGQEIAFLNIDKAMIDQAMQVLFLFPYKSMFFVGNKQHAYGKEQPFLFVIDCSTQLDLL